MSQTSSAATVHAASQTRSHPVLSRSPQSALDIVEPELVDALTRVSEQLDTIVEQSLNDEAPAQALAEKLAAQLDEVAGVFTMLNLPVAADLSVQLGDAVKKVCQTQRPIEEKEYQALFQSAYLLPRFFEYVQATGVTSPLLLAPCFYALASAGLAPFVAESELMEFDYSSNDVSQSAAEAADDAELSLVPMEAPAASANGEADPKTFRRLRQMYQTGLIGMLRDDNVAAKLVLLDRVAERCIGLCEGTPVQFVWNSLRNYISATSDEQLELTPQRRHFFAKFDRVLKHLEQNPAQAMQQLPATPVLRELTLLLLLADANNSQNSELNALGSFAALTWTDAAVVEHREAMERSTHKALLTMLEVIKEELGGGKRILDMMSESGICESDDIDTLIANCERISAVLKIGGFATATAVIDDSIEKIVLWRGGAPDQEDLLDVANMMLYIENALLTGSLNNASIDEDKDSTVALGLLQQAQADLFVESKANIGLAKRAVTSYIESNFDREHIANVSVSLQSIAGAFSMVDIEAAHQLMMRCATLISEEYESHSSIDSEPNVAVLENLADALVSVEYLLDELATGREMEAGVKKLIDESLEALG